MLPLVVAAALCASPGVAAASAPSVSITHPGPGGRAWGTTDVGADAQASAGVARVEFRVDDTLAGTDTSAPFELRWNASGLQPGSTHLLTARAVDSAGTATTSATVDVTISRPLPLGSAVTSTGLNGDATYRSAFLTRFGSMTPETEMKMDALQPTQGQFNFSAADQMVSFAETNGKQLRGHTLVWGNSLPGWLTSRTWTRDELLAILRNHVQTVVAHFRGRVKAWDVVNEAWNWDGTWRQNFWYQGIGPEYVEDAFRWAREADPDAKLFYNDYSAERVNTKSDAIYAMLADFKTRGVPVDAIGFQAHAWKDWVASANSLRSNLRRFAALGLDIEFTEMDLKSSELTGLTSDDRLRQAAEIYRRYAAACQEVPACKGLTVWGVGDAASWLGPAEAPVLLDGAYAPKPAWSAVADELAIGSGPAVPPETSLAGGRTGATSASDAGFTFSSTDPRAVFECRLGGGAWSPCSSPVSYSGLADGTYTFEVRSKDLAANPDPTPASRSWTVDTQAPAPTIESPTASAVLTDFSPDVAGTAGSATGDDATITLSVYEGAAAAGTPLRVLTAAVGGGAWTTTVAPDLPPGTYTLAVAQRDAAGNAGTSGPVTIAIDAPADATPPPEPAPTPPPATDPTPPPEPDRTPPPADPAPAAASDPAPSPAEPAAEPTAPAASPPAAAPSPRLHASATSLRALIRRGLRVELSGFTGAHARLELWLSPTTARRLGLRARRTLLAAAEVRLTAGAGTKTLRVAPRFRSRLAESPQAILTLDVAAERTAKQRLRLLR
ncbi:MAG TPA: endo-1,4-beta-xylanase [Thermoleophilaceae bacterium]|nr:endo-1,4-beta-xylanase [Thermoleophilaceae bacterium]